MSWASIATNQTISCNNLQDAVTTGVLCLKSAIPVSTKQITKTEANTYVNLYPNYPPYVAKAVNQLVVKSDLPNQLGYATRFSNNAYRTYDGGNNWVTITPSGLASTISDVACSSTGNYVTLLLENSNVYYSSDYGNTWGSVGFTPNAATFIAMSKDGQYQTLCRYGDYLYRSTNWGINWAQVTSAGARNWYAIAISSSGQYQTAGDGSSSGYIYRSTDYGVSFTPLTSAGARYWMWGAAMSNTGQYQYIIGNDGLTAPFTSQIYRSTDYGATWAAVQSTQYKRSIECSSSGQYVMAGTDGGQVWLSSNYGVTWTQANLYPSGSTLWSGIAISATGQNMFAANYAGSQYSYYSTDYGANWTQSSLGAIPLAAATFATESCYISTTTTSTTAIPTVNFSTSAGCANGSSSDGTGAMVTFSGGSGVYQASNITYASEALALAGTYVDSTAPKTFTGLAAGTYWVALRDKNDFGNKVAHSFVVTVCTTTTTTTQPPVTFDITSTCTGTTQTITISNFAGGDGVNYYANTTTYADSPSAGAAGVTLVGGPSSSRSYPSQPASSGNYIRFVKVTSGTKQTINSAGTCCDTAASYTNVVGTYYYCVSGSVLSTTVYSNSNSCYSGANTYYDAVHGATPTNYSNSSPSTAAVWVDNGSVRCDACVNQKQQTDTNQCSPTYGSTQWVYDAFGSTCNYSPTWVNRDINTYWVCVGVDKYYEQINTNPCYTGTQTQTGALYATNSPDCGYVPPSYTLNIYAKRNGIAGQAVYLKYNTGSGWVNVPTDISRNTSCLFYTSVTVTTGTTVSFAAYRISDNGFVPMVSDTTCPTSFTGEVCQPFTVVSANANIYLSIDTNNTGFGCPSV